MGDDFLAHCRSSLENVDCPWVDQLPDSELETWLFKPGSQHNKALIWALTKIEPGLREHLHQVQEKNMQKEIVKWFACTGLVKSTECDKVLGHASRKVQQSFWESVLYYLCILRDSDLDEDQENIYPGSSLSCLSFLISNPNFWDLLEKKSSLLPTDFILPPMTATLEDLQKQLAETEENLDGLSDTSDLSLGDTCSSSHNSDSRQKRVQKDLVERIQCQRINIDDNYKKFLQQIVPVLKRSAPNPAAEQLAQIVVNLHDQLNEFAQFLENVDKTKCLATSFSHQSMTENSTPTKNSVHDFIATMAHQISTISAAISVNNDVLDL